MRRQPSCLTCARLLHSILFHRPIRRDYEMDYPRASRSLSFTISGESTSIFLQSNSWSQKHGGFLMNLTSFYTISMATADASTRQSGSILSRGSFHTLLDLLEWYFDFCSINYLYLSKGVIFMNFSDFYDLFKDVQVIYHILGLVKEWRINKTLKLWAIATWNINRKFRAKLYEVFSFVWNRYLKIIISFF